DEKQFAIPDSWMWVRLPEITYGAGNKSNQILAKEVKPEGKYPAVSQGAKLIDGYYDFDEKIVFDLPLVMFGDHTRNVKYIDFPFVVSADGTKFMKAVGVEAKYLYYWMTFIAEHLRNRGYARHFTLLVKEPVPLPPLAEQKRIVAKIEELLPYIERYEKAWSKLEELNKRFPSDMQKSILQFAIQGKLVEQREDEGTAKVLYKQIQAEKKRLIKAGKIKKEKPLPEIKEDEKPFDIPDSWMWVRLRTVVYNRGQETPSALFSYIDIGSIDNKKQRLNTEENLIDADRAPSRARKVVEFGDILYSTVRPYLHNMCIIDRKFSCKPIASTGFAAMTCYGGIYNKYLFSYLMSPAFDSYANHTENAKGVAYPAINDDRLYRAIVPLPPLAEQRRIVAKIEELMPLCERLKFEYS
ncbi:MAG TPA: restriction endonuclease subunit S, partial [Clostridia bacterium]|nr:restriction endonuclease subunit S [Clostridia bacterium]